MDRRRVIWGSRAKGAILLALLCICAAGVAAAADSGSVPPSPPEPTVAQLKKEQALLAKLEHLENEYGSVTGLAIPHLLDLGGLYIEEDRCNDAIPVLTHGLKLSRALDGLFNLQQMELSEPLMECYLALDLAGDFEREQRYAQIVSDTNFGKNDPRALATLQKIGLWYEQAGWYISAREIYSRAVDIARRAGGGVDLRMVPPLRSIARSFRLEYVHGVDPIDDEEKKASPMRSRAQLHAGQMMLDRLGEDSLKRAISILRTQPDADRTDLVATLLDLGDWYQTGYVRRDALRVYQEAWQESSTPGYAGEAQFAEPVRVLYRPQNVGIALRRPPPNRENYNRYWAAFEFTVTSDGDVKDVKVTESNAPQSHQWRATDALRQTRYRPRFVDGQPVTTEHVKVQQAMWVEKQSWWPKIQ